jgi:cytoskeleton protein RodZ
MFEIGSSLQQARVRQKLTLADAERATRIRGRYLEALEDERFELLPEPAYAKGFLRTYAEFLGLESQPFVDEYNARFAPNAEPTPTPPPRSRRRPRRRDLRLLALPVAALLAVLGWRIVSAGSDHGEFRPPAPPRAPATTPVSHPARRHVVRKPTRARLVLVAARGPCWVSVRRESEAGALLFEQTLQPGQSARFVAKRLWMRVGAPWNLDATVNGKRLGLPGAIGNLVVTGSGANAG